MTPNRALSAAGFISPLESLRGWAILLVVVFHYYGILGGSNLLGADASLWLGVIAAGNTGVTLFFVLSGFLLTLPFIKAHKSGAKLSLRRFYLARALRILPLYYLAVLVAWLVSGNTFAALKAVFFLPVGFEIFPYSVPWWSLATEVQFYLLLPLLMLAMGLSWGRWLCGGLLAVWWMAHVTFALFPVWFDGMGLHWLHASIFGRGTAFLVGALCAYFYLSGYFQACRARPLLLAALALGVFCSLLYMLRWYGLQGQQEVIAQFALYHDVEALLWGLLLLCSVAIRGRPMMVFINPLLAHFGTISYSLYLVHVPVQFYLIYAVRGSNQGLPIEADAWQAVLLSFCVSWLLAVACYFVIERPFLQLKAQLGRTSNGSLPAHPSNV